MTKKEMTSAFALASNKHIDLFNEDLAVFDGFGLKNFKRVFVTVRQVARLIRWQAQRMDGTWDSDEVNGIATHGRKLFQIIG